MLDFKKIKYSFVLCLALLFSISFCTTLTYNDTEYEWNLPYDFTINSFSDNYFLAYGDVKDVLDGGIAYRLIIYDYEEFLDGLTVLGFNSQTDDINSFFVSNLKPVGQNEYDFCGPYVTSITFFSDLVYVIDGGGGHEVLPSSELITINGNGDYQPYQNIYTFGPMQILHSDYDVYVWDTETRLLGSLVYDGTSSGGVVLPFSTTRTQQQINDAVLSIFNSSSFKSNLPDNYVDFFVIYDEDLNRYTAFYYPKDTQLLGLIYKSNSTTIEGYRIEMTPYGWWNDGDFPIVSFVSTGSEALYFNTTYYSEFKNYYFDYYAEPVVYSSSTIPFKVVLNGVISDYVSFTTSPFDITENGNIVTAGDILDEPKDSNNIFTIIWNLLNPKSNSTSDMSSIEEGHNDIMRQADFNSYKSLYLSNNSILDLSSISWLFFANTLLFSYFSPFILLCVFFIMLSRILGG